MGIPTCPDAERTIVTKRMIQASQGIATCAPDAANATSNGLLTVCSSAWVLMSVLALQLWRFTCYLWGAVQTLQEDVAALPSEADFTELTAQVDAIGAQLPPPHPVGTPTLVAGAAAGSSPTLILLAGSTDTDGVIMVICGTSPTAGGGLIVQLVFANSFTNAIRVLLTVGGPTRAFTVQHTPVLSGPVTSAAIYLFDPTAGIVAANQFRVSYSVRELA